MQVRRSASRSASWFQTPPCWSPLQHKAVGSRASAGEQSLLVSYQDCWDPRGTSLSAASQKLDACLGKLSVDVLANSNHRVFLIQVPPLNLLGNHTYRTLRPRPAPWSSVWDSVRGRARAVWRRSSSWWKLKELYTFYLHSASLGSNAPNFFLGRLSESSSKAKCFISSTLLLSLGHRKLSCRI